MITAFSKRGAAVLIGVLVLVISLAHVPAIWEAVNRFDPPKRLGWALVALALACAWKTGASRISPAGKVAAFGLLTWMALRSFFRPQPSSELDVLFAWGLPVLLLVLAARVRAIAEAAWVGVGLFLAGAVQAGLMLLQGAGWDPFGIVASADLLRGLERMIGTMGSSDQAAGFLALSGAGLFIATRRRALRLPGMMALVAATLATGRGGAPCALAAAFLIAEGISVALDPSASVAARWRRTGMTALALAMTFAAVLALSPKVRDGFRTLAADPRHSPEVGSRILTARAAAQMFSERPWVGWGAGEYAAQYLDRQGALLPEPRTREAIGNAVHVREAHNDGLQFAAEFGLVGVFWLVLLVGAGVTALAEARRRQPDAVTGIAFIAVYMSLAALHSFPWQTAMAGPLAGLLIGLLWPQGGVTGAEGSVVPAPAVNPPRPLLKGAVIGMTLVAVLWFAADVWFNTLVLRRLGQGRPADAERWLPCWAYRYQALVGTGYALQKDLPSAERALESAQRGFHNVPLWDILGRVYAMQGRWDEARGLYERWVRCGVDHSAALLRLAKACEKTGRWRDAAAALAERMRLWPGPAPEEIKRLLILQLKARECKEALVTLEQYRPIWTNADPRARAEIQNVAGAICQAQDDRAGAETWYREALKTWPDLPSARTNLDWLSTAPPPQMIEVEEDEKR